MRPRLPLRRTWTSIAAISALLVATRVHAQSADAQALFNDGDRLIKQGKIAEACEAFEASNRIEARAGTLIRLGDCREKNNELASAWSAYKDALTRVKDPKKQKLAQGRIAYLEPRLSYLTITVQPQDGLALERNGKPIDPGLWNRATPVNGGEYTITASAPDHAPWKQTVSVPNEHGNVSVAVPKLDAVANPVDDKPKPAPEPPRAEPHPAEHGTFTTRRGIAVGVLAVGAGATVVGALLGSSAKSKRDQAYALCPSPTVVCSSADEANSLISTAHTRAFEADGAFAAGAVAVIVAGALWFTGAPVAAEVDAHGGSVALVGRF